MHKMKRVFTLFVALASFDTFGTRVYAQKSTTYLLSIAGGNLENNTTEAPFYQHQVDLYQSFQSLGIKKDFIHIFNGTYTYNKHKEGPPYVPNFEYVVRYTTSKFSEFEKDPTNCELLEAAIREDESFASEKNIGMVDFGHNSRMKKLFTGTNLKGGDFRDLDNDGTLDSRGPAVDIRTRTKEVVELKRAGYTPSQDLFNSISEISSLSDQGDFIIFDLNAHGSYDSPIEYSALLGTRNDLRTHLELGDYFASLLENRSTLLATAFTCNSGHFLKLMHERFDSEPRFCGIALTASGNTKGLTNTWDTLDVTLPRNLQKHQSYLQAYACSLATETLNKPSTTLDFLTERTSNTSTHIPDLDIDSFAEHELRNTLLKKIASDFEKPFKDCRRSHKTEWEKFHQPHLACLSKTLTNLTDDQIEKWRTIFSQPSYTVDLDEKLSQYNEYLNEQDLHHLLKFRDQLCCFSYDLLNQSFPEFCGRTS